MTMKKGLLSIAMLWALGSGLGAQEHAPTPARPAPTAETPQATAHTESKAAATEKGLGPADIIMPHLVDSRHLEVPCFKGLGDERTPDGTYHAAWAIHLPSWPLTIGGTTIDFGPTKHTVWLLIAAIIAGTMLVSAARAHKRQTEETGHPRGFAAALEAVILYLRNDIYLPVLGGHGGEKFVPYCLSLFFFIAVANLLGLLPYGSTATGNLAVTATLAIITFITIEIAGMRALGKGYLGTIVYWPHDMPLYLKLPLTLIMTPIEIISKFTKPFALTVRLFANMVAGHVIILSLIGIIFLFGGLSFFGLLSTLLAVVGALFINAIEVLVVFIQAFIFSLLAAVFIGQIRTAHH
jgi:F-type H+-transporting ATPase subunit a